MNIIRLARVAVLTAAFIGLAPTVVEAQLIRSGTNIGAITARDQFRLDLGGGNVAGPNGSFGGVRREINWDGVPAAFAAPNALPANFFNANSPRGAVFSTPGTGFQVSGATTDSGGGQPAAPNFGNIDPSYTNTFLAFSAPRLFTAIGSNIVDVNFFVPGTNTPAGTSGFGAIFTDVDLQNTTSIQFFDTSNVSLGTFFVPNVAGANQTFSFFGVSFTGILISRVRITNGNFALAPGVIDGGAIDLVVMDDFLYAEPTTAVPESGAGFAGWFALAGVLIAATLRRRTA